MKMTVIAIATGALEMVPKGLEINRGGGELEESRTSRPQKC